MMHTDETSSNTQKAEFQAFLHRFAREEDGVITAMTCFMILMMVFVGGIGIDLMRNEMERVRIQNIADRAVLAAADMEQEKAPIAVVNDYFAKSSPDAKVKSVSVDQGANYRRVTVDASTYTPTSFMDVFGTYKLPVPGYSVAEERVNQVEISLVLDISGSMGNNGKMKKMRDAAKDFVDTVINHDTDGQVSLSLVPYSAHVNAGDAIAKHLKLKNSYHQNSWCIEFDDQDFDSVKLDTSKTYEHMQHFMYYTSGNRLNVRRPVCSHEAHEEIRPLSKDATALKKQIDAFKPKVQTSIFIGVKWAAGLLDPSFRSTTAKLIADGVVEAEFSGRPANYDHEDTVKTIIVMTDGVNTESRRLHKKLYKNRDHAAHWAKYNFGYVHKYHLSDDYRNNNAFYEKYSHSKGNRLLNKICTAAKDKKIVIWTIGFEVTKYADQFMLKCASSPSHYFSVKGNEIQSAFASIARQINQLRLTQ